MEIMHRYNSNERQHYLLERHYTFKLKPRLLYVGSLDKHGGWREEPHSHHFLEVIFVSDGSGTVVIEDQSYDVHRGDLLVYNAEILHFEKSSDTDPMEILFVAYDKLEITDLPPNWLLPPSYGYVFHSGDMYDIFYKYFTTLVSEFDKKERFYTEIAQNVSRTLLMYMFRLINQTENAAGLLESGKTMETALRFIDENFRREITLDELAEKCFTNKYYLSHLFTRSQGISVGKYILNKRIKEAKRQLENKDRSVAEIANDIGFNDPSYFCRVFKKETGITPLAYRKRAVV